MESRIEVRSNVLKEAGPLVIAHNAADGVVAATRTWTFTNASLSTIYEGKTLTVAGAANAGNNGEFIIEQVTGLHTLVTVAKGVLTDEAFGGGVTQQIDVDSCWSVQAAATKFEITFADGTVVEATTAQEFLDNLKSIIKQAEMRGVQTGGPHKWVFSAKGTACFLTTED